MYEGPGKHRCPIGNEYRTEDYRGINLEWDAMTNIHGNLFRSTFPLAQAYARSGDSRYADRAKEIYNGYAKKYFTYQPMDLDKNYTIDKGRTVFAKYMESFNLDYFFRAYDLLKGCGAFSQKEAEKLEHDLHTHGCRNDGLSDGNVPSSDEYFDVRFFHGSLNRSPDTSCIRQFLAIQPSISGQV
jgi:hypothetical protein